MGILDPPAPFALVFLVRILRTRLEKGKDDAAAQWLSGQFAYYGEICADAEGMQHPGPLESFSDLLAEDSLLPKDCTEDELMEVFEDPGALCGEYFCSLCHYSMIVISQVQDILDHYGVFSEESEKIREMPGCF